MTSCTVDGSIARITLSRPEKRNAINMEVVGEITHALEHARADDAVRVILITGAGADFCSGMDLSLLEETADAGILKHIEIAGRLAGLYRGLRQYPKPVIAGVRGRALGGGCGLATACDIVLAAESAWFGYPEIKIGFVPAIVMSMLRRSVGEKRAFELLATGEPVAARDALEIGMITRVYPDSEFEPAVEAYVAALAEKSASALALTKKLFYGTDGMTFDAAIEAGVQSNAIARMTEDARRGIAQFVKRKR